MEGRATKPRPSNLPAELTSFVGRRRELAEIKRLLTTTRLLTLTGSGGAGKTRLALRAATEMARNFPDGVWLVSLAPIDDPLLITQAVFGALGVPDLSSRWSLSALSDYLREKRLLLVLDNCEHLLDGSAGLAGALLKSCSGLRILATSRQALGMTGESRLRVPPLSLPTAVGPFSPGQIASFDAVALLIERAAAVRPGFSVDDANSSSVLQLCRRLDGMPLALELAAVRLEGITIDRLLAGLDRELSAGSGLRGGEARQRTVEATLDWSFALLSPKQKQLWAQLSVFAVGFDEEAAITVCSDPGTSDDDFSNILAALVETSITHCDHTLNPPRYSMLETVRNYGQRKLRELGEEVQLQERHRDWVLHLASTAGTFDTRQPEAFKVIHRERDNVWSALEFCRRQPGQAAVGVEICAWLTDYWLSRGPLKDVRRYLESLLTLTEPNSASRARCLIGVALLANALDDAVTAESTAQQALGLATELGDPVLAGLAAGSLLFAAFVLQKSDGVDALSRSMIEAGQSSGSPSMVAIAMHYTCSIWLGQGKLDEVVAMGEAALAICRDAGDLFVRGMVLNSLAEARRQRGAFIEAEALALEGVTCKYALDDRRGLATLIETLAWIAHDRRDHTRSATLLGCAQSLRDSMAVPLLAPFVARHQACEGSVQTRLSHSSFDKAFGNGLAMSVDRAVDYLLGQAPKVATIPEVKSPSALSRRELEIARLIAEGLTNREVATKLFISKRTVETHVANMLDKLGLSSRTQLARWLG